MNVPKRSEEVDKTDLQVIVNPEMGVPNVSTTSMQRFLKNSFKEQILLLLHPRTRIQILVQILHSDGSLLSSCFNAISMALLDAGIPLRSHLVSVDFILSKDNSLTIDPNCEQEKNSNTVASMSFQVSLEGKAVSELVHTIYATQEENQKNTIRFVPLEKYWDARQLALRAAVSLHRFVRITTTSKCLYECHGTAY